MNEPEWTVAQQKRCAWTLYAVLLVVCLPLWWSWRQDYRARLRERDLPVTVQRAQPIINAIHRYAEDHGSPPSDLEHLIPDYLPELPDAGPVAEDGWRYGINDEIGKWSLRVGVCDRYSPEFAGDGDTFAYHPDGQYPTYAYGGILMRYGRWGYYNDRW